MDIYAHPADGEGFGLAVVEAMLAKRPTVAARAGAIPEIVEHQRNGLLAEPGDPASLLEALERLAGDPALRESLGATARADCLARFSPELYTESLTSALLSAGGGVALAEPAVAERHG
jgi:glycosyltransferase involved in cell wall biosynthesis